MKLLEIELNNFRNLYGTHKIEFSNDHQKSITLVLANNGFGKTTVLNGIYWCLFGLPLGDFDIGSVLNTRAMKENICTISVRLVFEDDDHKYEVKRSMKFFFHAGGKSTVSGSEFNMIQISDNGNSTPVPDNLAQKIIYKALPEQMARLFIFEGEGKADEYLRVTNSDYIARDIRRVIGAEEVTQLIDDLESIYKSDSKNIRQNSKNGELDALVKTLETFEQSTASGKTSLEQFKVEIMEKKHRINELNDIIHSHKDAEEIEQKKRRIEKEIAINKLKLSEIGSRMTKWVRDRSIIAIAQKAANEADDIIDDTKLHGKLPGDYQESFIDRLINEGKCICGTAVEQGSNVFAALVACKSGGDNSAQIQAALQTTAGISSARSFFGSAVDDLKLIESDDDRMATQLVNLELDLENANRQLENVPIEKVKQANIERNRLSSRIEELNRWTGDKTRKQNELLQDKADIEKKIRQLESGAPAIQKAMSELDEVKDLIVFAKDWLAKYEQTARSELTQMVNETLVKLDQGFEAFFDESFNLSIMQKSTGVEIQKNRGTGQLLALAFITSLVRFCEKRKNTHEILLTSGTIAPLVLDAPFGVLDEGVRRIVANLLPQMAQQIVVLVTDSQSSVFMDHKLRESVGVAYAIIHETPSDMNAEENLKRRHFAFPGKTFEVTRPGPTERYYFEKVSI